MKSEPGTYSISDLERDGRTAWEGVRNYQARNYMRDSMRQGDRVFFYHSSCAEPAIVGLARVCSAAYPDPSARKRTSPYYDPKATAHDPRWYLVDVCFERIFQHPLTLSALRGDPALATLPLVRKGNRLSVMPVDTAQARHLLARMAKSQK